MDKGLLLIFLCLVAFQSLENCNASKRIKRNPEAWELINRTSLAEEQVGRKLHPRFDFLVVGADLENRSNVSEAQLELKDQEDALNAILARLNNYNLRNETSISGRNNSTKTVHAKPFPKKVIKKDAMVMESSAFRNANNATKLRKLFSKHDDVLMPVKNATLGATENFSHEENDNVFRNIPMRFMGHGGGRRVAMAKKKKHHHGHFFKPEPEFNEEKERVASITKFFKFANTLLNKLSGSEDFEPIHVREHVTLIKPSRWEDVEPGSYYKTPRKNVHRELPSHIGAGDGGTMPYVQPVFIRPLLTLNQGPLDLFGLEDKHPELIDVGTAMDDCPIHRKRSGGSENYLKALREVNEAAAGFGQCQFIETEELGDTAAGEGKDDVIKVCTCHLIKKTKPKTHILK